MIDETKLWMSVVGCVALGLVCVTFLIFTQDRRHAELRLAACANPETVACALAVRR
jgi:hypothetical protein